MKPMKEWTTKEVANWLYCTGFVDNEETRKLSALIGSGLDLYEMPETENHELVELIGKDVMEKLLQQIEFAKSLEQHGSTDEMTKELAAALDKLTLEKIQMEKELVTKDEKIAELEQKVVELSHTIHPDKHPEDRLLAMEHRHEVERKRMEERHEQETKIAETEIRYDRSIEEENELRPDKGVPQPGKRHFKEEPTGLHRFY